MKKYILYILIVIAIVALIIPSKLLAATTMVGSYVELVTPIVANGNGGLLSVMPTSTERLGRTGWSICARYAAIQNPLLCQFYTGSVPVAVDANAWELPSSSCVRDSGSPASLVVGIACTLEGGSTAESVDYIGTGGQ